MTIIGKPACYEEQLFSPSPSSLPPSTIILICISPTENSEHLLCTYSGI